jgi:hypothetical protein
MTTNNDVQTLNPVHAQAIFERAKLGVALAESHNKDIGVHDDGKSYGRLGVTVSACAQLFKLHLITDDEYAAIMNKPALLADPVLNDRYGSMYLRHVCERDKTQAQTEVDYVLLVGRYHGGSSSRQRRYYERVVVRLYEYDKRMAKKDTAMLKSMHSGWRVEQCPCIMVPVETQVAK